MSEQMQGFGGFPAGKLPTTPIPNPFFSELLPLIDDLAELKVTLHLFWLIGRKHGALRYARLGELLKDGRLLAGLANCSSRPLALAFGQWFGQVGGRVCACASKSPRAMP